MAFIDELRGYAKAMANYAVSGVDYPLGACAEAMEKAAQEIERLNAAIPRQMYEFRTFGHYRDDTTPRTMLSSVMNSLMESGWETFSITNEASGFFRKRATYLLHCRRPKL